MGKKIDVDTVFDLINESHRDLINEANRELGPTRTWMIGHDYVYNDALDRFKTILNYKIKEIASSNGGINTPNTTSASCNKKATKMKVDNYGKKD